MKCGRLGGHEAVEYAQRLRAPLPVIASAPNTVVDVVVDDEVQFLVG